MIIIQVLPRHYMPNVSWLTTLTILSINSWSTCTCFVYFKSKKELNYDRFVDLNILGAARLVHSDLQIYWISLWLNHVYQVKLLLHRCWNQINWCNHVIRHRTIWWAGVIVHLRNEALLQKKKLYPTLVCPGFIFSNISSVLATIILMIS